MSSGHMWSTPIKPAPRKEVTLEDLVSKIQSIQAKIDKLWEKTRRSYEYSVIYSTRPMIPDHDLEGALRDLRHAKIELADFVIKSHEDSL